MQPTNANYDAIINSGKYGVEYRVYIQGDLYTQSDITQPPVISSGVFENFSIGNAVASQLDLYVVDRGTIPAMATIRVQFRVYRNYGTQRSGWFNKGTFYVDTRQLGHDGIVHITAYDAMLKTEYTFMESGSWVSTTTKAVVEMIASDIGVGINGGTSQILNDGKTVPIVPVIGPDGTTARKMLCAIASMYGGNFIIDEVGNLKLLQLSPSGKNIFNMDGVGIESGAIASANGQNTASSTRVRTAGYVPVSNGTTYTISSNVNKVFILQYSNNSGGYLNIFSGWQTLPFTFTTNAQANYIRIVFAKDDSTTVQPSYVEWAQIELGSEATAYTPFVSGIDIGVQMTSLDTSPAFQPIDRVIVRTDYNNEVGYRSPELSDADWDAMTGRVLEAVVPWTSQEIADDLLDIVAGFIYQPYEALGAQINPACQLGDAITANGTTSLIYKAVVTLDPRMAQDISAPYDEEINHEYPYRSPAQRIVENAVTQEQLATAGQTVINGGNIMTDTIQTEGTYPSGVVGRTKLEAGTVHSTGEGEVYVSGETDYFEAIFEASGITTKWHNTEGKSAETFVDIGEIVLKTSDGTNTAEARMSTSPSVVPVPVTRTGGASTSFTATLYTFGRVAMLTIVIQYGSAVSAFGDYFRGTVKDAYKPKATVHAHTSWYEHQILCSLEPDGSIVMRDASGSSSAFNSGTATVTFTYIF